MAFSARSVPVRAHPQPHKPAPTAPEDFAVIPGSVDPAQSAEAAHMSAAALLNGSRDAADAQLRHRILNLAQNEGLEVLAQLWSHAAAVSLPGALWRLYVLHAGVHQRPADFARYYREGRPYADVSAVVAGVSEPPGPEEMAELAEQILHGMFSADFDTALDRAAAFCVVVAAGMPPQAGQRLHRTGVELAAAARNWRAGTLH